MASLIFQRSVVQVAKLCCLCHITPLTGLKNSALLEVGFVFSRWASPLQPLIMLLARDLGYLTFGRKSAEVWILKNMNTVLLRLVKMAIDEEAIIEGVQQLGLEGGENNESSDR